MPADPFECLELALQLPVPYVFTAGQIGALYLLNMYIQNLNLFVILPADGVALFTQDFIYELLNTL